MIVSTLYVVQVNAIYGFGYRYVFEKAYMFKRETWLFCVVVRCKFEGVCIHVFVHLKVWTHAMNSFN